MEVDGWTHGHAVNDSAREVPQVCLLKGVLIGSSKFPSVYSIVEPGERRLDVAFDGIDSAVSEESEPKVSLPTLSGALLLTDKSPCTSFQYPGR